MVFLLQASYPQVLWDSGCTSLYVSIIVVSNPLHYKIFQKMTFRGVFPDAETREWDEATKIFPNRVPRFTNKDDAVAFTKAHCTKPSHPDEPGLRHSITTLTEWSQIERYLLPKIFEYNRKWQPILPENEEDEDTQRKNPSDADSNDNNDTDGRISASQNRFMNSGAAVYAELAEQRMTAMDDDEEGTKNVGDDTESVYDYANARRVYQYLISRLDLSVHHVMTSHSTLNTLRYLFYHMKCGIYVMIRNNKVVIFSPFVNKHYTNNWGSALAVDSVDGTLESYYAAKRASYRQEEIIDRSQWWANGNIICNEHEAASSSSSSSGTAVPLSSLSTK